MIEIEMKKLIPSIGDQNYLSLKTRLSITLDLSKNYEQALDLGKSLIAELRNYENDHEKYLLILAITNIRFPFRNSTHLNEGFYYIRQLANDFENAGDSGLASICYYDLGGFYRVLGLTDKAIYSLQKSVGLLNRNIRIMQEHFIISEVANVGLFGCLNHTAVIGGLIIDYDDPPKALPYLYDAKKLFEELFDSTIASDGNYVLLQLARVKMITGDDSAVYYLNLFRSYVDTTSSPDYHAAYWQENGYYYYLNEKLDSASFCVEKAAEIFERNHLMINSSAGFLIPGYCLSLIRIKQKKYDDAIRLLTEESDRLSKINARRWMLKEWLLLSSVYKAMGNYKQSTVELEKYNELLQTVIADENKSRTMSFETEQQINALNAQKKEQELEIERQKSIRNWTVAGLSIFILFSVIFLFQRIRISKEKKRSERLLLNILPEETAAELKATGTAKAKDFDEVTVMFTDFKNFTIMSEQLNAQELVNEINYCYSAFDNIISKYGIEKIKTIGDSYMCAGGLPTANKTHAADVVTAAIEIRDFMLREKARREAEGKPFFEIRIGCHTGPVVAGIVGIKKFAYDIWGDTVNIASRMESSGEVGKVNISGATHELVKDKFKCEYRGKISAKNKGEIDMYFAEESTKSA